MRCLVDGGSLDRSPGRLRDALSGLARRGHDIAWLGAGPPALEGVRGVAAMRELGGARPDLVVAAGEPWRAALLGWRSHARGMLVDLGEPGRWGLLDGLAWGQFPGFALIEPGRSAAAREMLPGAVLPGVALWPDGMAPGAGGPAHPDTAFLERAGERVLARARGPRAWPALFLDRDGTLIVERGYLADPEQVELLPGVAESLRAVQAAGIALVVISNQAGVGRGLFTIDAAWATMARMRRLLRAQGVELDAVRFCPHAPDARCPCRKPGTRLLEDAADDLHLSLTASAMVGDRWLDAAAGRAAGGTGVLLRTGYGREEEGRIAAGGLPAPDLVLDDLHAVAGWAIGRMEAL